MVRAPFLVMLDLRLYTPFILSAVGVHEIRVFSLLPSSSVSAVSSFTLALTLNTECCMLSHWTGVPFRVPQRSVDIGKIHRQYTSVPW